MLRACELLDELSRHPTEAFSVSELARRIGVPRATCDSLLLALAEKGLALRRDDDLRYEIGPKCVVLGDAARVANSVLVAAGGEAERLARQTSSCVAVATRRDDEARVAEVFDFGPPFGIRARVGQSIPLVPPFGAVLIAWADDEEVRRWLEQPTYPLSPPEIARYRVALDAVRRRGYSVTVVTDRRPELVEALEKLITSPDAHDARRKRDELIREMSHSEYLATDIDAYTTMRVSQLSAPVFDRAGKVAAMIIVLGPDYDITPAELGALAEQLLRSVAAATERAGGRAPELVAATTNGGHSS